MYIITYADAKNHIKRKSGFWTEAEAAAWIERAKNITPLKMIMDDPAYEGCTITVKNYNNYQPGKHIAEYLI